VGILLKRIEKRCGVGVERERDKEREFAISVLF
jgi:hypothetical protein